MRKCVTISICNEGEDPALSVVHRQWFDLKTNGTVQHIFDAVCRTNDTLRERVRTLELELQRAETQNNKLSEELATVNRIRVNCEEKIRKIDDIISPF